MKENHRVMLGRKSIYAEECLKGGFIGADFGLQIDLTIWKPLTMKHMIGWHVPPMHWSMVP